MTFDISLKTFSYFRSRFEFYSKQKVHSKFIDHLHELEIMLYHIEDADIVSYMQCYDFGNIETLKGLKHYEICKQIPMEKLDALLAYRNMENIHLSNFLENEDITNSKSLEQLRRILRSNRYYRFQKAQAEAYITNLNNFYAQFFKDFPKSFK